MRLISWNVAGRSGKQAAQAGALLAHAPDVVALQDVTKGTVARWREALAKAGLTACLDSSEHVAERKYFNLIAARYPLEPLPTVAIRFPERLLSAVIDSPWGAVEIQCRASATGRHPRSDQGRDVRGDSRRTASTSSYGPSDSVRRLQHTPIGKHRRPGADLGRSPFAVAPTLGRGGAERLDGLAAYDLPDVFRQLNGYARRDVSWVWKGHGREVGRRFDHVFASPSLNPVRCEYVHDWRRADMSDHSAIETDFRRWEGKARWSGPD